MNESLSYTPRNAYCRHAMIATGLQAVAACLALLITPVAGAEVIPQQPNWTAEAAGRAVGRVDTLEELKPLFKLARDGRDQELLGKLQSLAADETWPLPAREKVLHDFALGLADLRVNAVGPDILSFLDNYRPATLIPHDEQARFGVPMYTISAAAAGISNAWERQAATSEAAEFFNEPGDAWVPAFLAAGGAPQQGYADALTSVSPEALRRIATTALSYLPHEPALTAIAVRAALLLPDAQLLQDAIRSGSGPALGQALRSAEAALDESERAAVLRDAVRYAPAVNASLVLAELGPSLLHQPATADLLFALLGDPELGASAALILSRDRDPGMQERLAALRARDDGLASRRARLASELAEQDDGAGVPW
jgi:hypothetical protein